MHYVHVNAPQQAKNQNTTTTSIVTDYADAWRILPMFENMFILR